LLWIGAFVLFVCEAYSEVSPQTYARLSLGKNEVAQNKVPVSSWNQAPVLQSVGTNYTQFFRLNIASLLSKKPVKINTNLFELF
jgi:hypothetical protein